MKYTLDDIDKKQGFEVPEGYFEDLPMKIQKRIEEEKKETKPFRLPSWSLAMAASIVVIVSLVFIFNNNTVSAEDMLAEIAEEDLVAYIGQLEMDEYDLADAFPDEAGVIDFEDINMFDGMDIEDESLDGILEEYNLEDELLEI